MKRILFILFTIICFPACGQDAQTFDKTATFNAGIRFSTTGKIYYDLPSASIKWDSILFKPLTFPPIAHTHDYVTDVTNKPLTMELDSALKELPHAWPPRLTTAEIQVYMPEEGDIVFNKDLKIWVGFKNNEWVNLIINK